MTDKTIYKDAPDYCHYFFDLVKTDNLLDELYKSYQITNELFQRITPEKENFSYQPDKWTTKEVIRHIIDCERVYTYRAFRFSRFDNTELPGFDENKYIEAVKGKTLHLSDLKEEYENIRKSTIVLFKTMTNEMLDFKGSANKVDFTARTLGFMTVGHNLHHCNFIKTKYLNKN
ncbi:DinB family protein [Flavobacterium sp. NRK F10]|uniref:Damage-inducible protein DinB n=1 Tax=Flavobacterium sediminis TaxID=2201181 RepID=A0A2U8QRM6_9FLAO|nr:MULTISPECIES: DinB family protein [Flavobacterium]AWM12822.1 damage-inducible protein DinB [Flavobacterium sediminis]MCO6173949.1 DinB family protein [Flavobacterium sp. NRK F10]